MIKIFTSPSCSSCRKVKKWFMEQNIPFIEKDIINKGITEKDLRELLTKSDNGTEDIISTRSKVIKDNHIDLEKLSLNELIDFVMKNPTVLKRPIIVDDHKIQVGYSPDEISTFLPMAFSIAKTFCSADYCPKYNDCEHANDK